MIFYLRKKHEKNSKNEKNILKNILFFKLKKKSNFLYIFCDYILKKLKYFIFLNEFFYENLIKFF